MLEALRVRPWWALAGGYRAETVEDCVTKAQTDFQRRQPEQLIDTREPRNSLSAVYVVGNRERAELAVRIHDILPHVGERHDVDCLDTEILSLLYRQGW